MKPTKADNQSVREWYVANVRDIPKCIDKTKPIEAQAKEAFEMRNAIKREARAMMLDEETLRILEKQRPIPDFESLIQSKMKRKNMTRQEAVIDILETAAKTNSEVNREFGL